MLWIKYHRNGKSIRESTHTTEVKEAEKLLRQRLAAISTGTYVGLKLKKMRVSEPGEVSMTLLVKPLLSQCVHRRGSDEDVFTREDGKPVRDFRGAWTNACAAAKVHG
jgi:hypothetical protein